MIHFEAKVAAPLILKAKVSDPVILDPLILERRSSRRASGEHADYGCRAGECQLDGAVPRATDRVKLPT